MLHRAHCMHQMDGSLPFELRAVEAALQAAAGALCQEGAALGHHALPLLDRLQQKVVHGAYLLVPVWLHPLLFQCLMCACSWKARGLDGT